MVCEQNVSRVERNADSENIVKSLNIVPCSALILLAKWSHYNKEGASPYVSGVGVEIISSPWIQTLAMSRELRRSPVIVEGLHRVQKASHQRQVNKPRQHDKKQRHHFADKGPYSLSYGFSSSHVWM